MKSNKIKFLDVWKGALGLLKEGSRVQNSIKCPIFFFFDQNEQELKNN